MSNDPIDWTPLEPADAWMSKTALTMARVRDIAARGAFANSTYAVIESWQRPVLIFTAAALLASAALSFAERFNGVPPATVLAHASEAWAIDGSVPSGARIANVLMSAKQ